MNTYRYRIWGILYGESGPARECEATCFRAAQDWIVAEIASMTEAAQRWHVVVSENDSSAIRFDVQVSQEGGVHVTHAWT